MNQRNTNTSVPHSHWSPIHCKNLETKIGSTTMNFEKKSSSVLESSCSIARLVYRCAVHQQKEIKKKKKKKIW